MQVFAHTEKPVSQRQAPDPAGWCSRLRASLCSIWIPWLSVASNTVGGSMFTTTNEQRYRTSGESRVASTVSPTANRGDLDISGLHDPRGTSSIASGKSCPCCMTCQYLPCPKRAVFKDHLQRTYLDTVSESPMTARCRFGLVMATMERDGQQHDLASDALLTAARR